MIVAVKRPVRTQSHALSPVDFDDIAPCESVEWGDGGSLVVTFPSDLTPAEVLAVRIRCISADPDEEALLTSAAQARATNRDFLDLVAPTNAQTLAEVKALARQVDALIRIELGDVAG